jgi:hypothetical protein
MQTDGTAAATPEAGGRREAAKAMQISRSATGSQDKTVRLWRVLPN